MTCSRLYNRRDIARLLAGASALAVSRAWADDTIPADRGIGGTGAAPEDRGIGGTGVIGTIRRFGSIIVNGLRIAYPRNAPVWIDGERTTASALKIGQVVNVLAEKRRGVLTTRSINVFSEVVGPIDSLSPHAMTVLGQSIELDSTHKAGVWRIGDVVAVSGLRKLDGTIVASLVDRREGAAFRVAGPATTAGANGAAMIGGLSVSGVAPMFLGQRVLVVGGTRAGVFEAATATLDPGMTLQPRASHASIEGYVRHDGDNLIFGSGLMARAGASAAAAAANTSTHAIISTRVDRSGNLNVETIRPQTPGGVSAPGRRGDMHSPASGNGAPRGHGGELGRGTGRDLGRELGHGGDFGRDGARAPALEGRPGLLGRERGGFEPGGPGPRGGLGLGAPDGLGGKGGGLGGFGGPGGGFGGFGGRR